MAKTDLISIIVPIYNTASYLETCILSILHQSYQNLEIILVNDGSTDHSLRICQKYCAIDSRVRLLNKEKNQGLSMARNSGIEMSTGTFITFVDSDDDITNDYIETLYDLIQKNQTDMAICSYSVIYQTKKGQTVVNLGKGYKEQVLSTEECLARMLCDQGFTVSSCAKLYKKELFSDVVFPEHRLCEDNGTTYRLILKCSSISYSNKSIYHYYVRQNSIMTSLFHAKKLDLLVLTNQMCEEILEYFPNLKNFCERREYYVKFSILRQMVFSKLDDELRKQKKILKHQLIQDRKKIFQNPVTDKRDKLALFSLLLGEPFFKFSWMVYTIFRRNQK